MADQTPLPERDYATSDASMIVGIGAITASALKHQEALEEEDTMLTKEYLEGLQSRINTAATTILGHDNAKGLRTATADLHEDTDTAIEALGSMLNTIKNKYREAPGRRDELLKSLGFDTYYVRASHKDQQALGQLLSRAAAALAEDNDALQTELKGRGMNQKRIDTVTSLAATYTIDNTGQEATKGARKLLSAGDVATLNALYHDVMEVAKTARHYFRNDSTLRSLFVFSKVAPPSRGGGDHGENPPA